MPNGKRNCKSSWPELVGINGKIAAPRIKYENCKVYALVILDGIFVNLDFRCDMVWVWVNKAGKVVRTPTIG
ncbi:hypothetical protein MKX01_020477 [Papaver californicum]|nr:hypothetical protein MKX01_020477 [Papaver californicum]